MAIKKKLFKKLRRIEKRKGQVSGGSDDPDDDDDDNDDNGSWCSSTYLDLIVFMNDVDFNSLAYIGGCDDPGTAEACNRIVRWINSLRDTMSNVKFHLPKMMSTRFVKFMLALSEINNIFLQFPVDSPFIFDHQSLHTERFWEDKIDREIERCTAVIQTIILKMEENTNLRRQESMLEFYEEFRERRHSLGLTQVEVLAKLNQLGYNFTENDIANFQRDQLGTQKSDELQPLLQDWMNNPENQVKSDQPAYYRRGNNFGYIKGTRFSCPHCTSFTHTRKDEVDRHIFEEHQTYPYNCAVCGKGLRYEKTLQRHMKDFHKSTAASEIISLTYESSFFLNATQAILCYLFYNKSYI